MVQSYLSSHMLYVSVDGGAFLAHAQPVCSLYKYLPKVGYSPSYRGSKPVPLKLTGMAVNRLKDHTGGKKHSTKVR